MDSKLLRNTRTAFTVLKRMVRPNISRVGVSVTWDCNQRCKTCDIWRINRENPELRKKEMALEEFQKFTRANPGLIWVCLTGGEPYLKKDLKGFLDAACDIPTLRLISITTNGSVPDKIEDDIRHFLRNGNKNVTVATQVSFEGPEKEQDEITGTPGSYRRALDSLKRLQRLAEEDSRVRPGVAYTISTFGLHNLGPTMESLGEACPPIGQITIGIGQEADYYHWVDDKKIVPDSLELLKDLEWIKGRYKLVDKLDPYGAISYAFLRKALRTRRNNTGSPRCLAGQYTCSVDPYWDVHPCVFMFQHNLGNLKNYNYDLRELLDDAKGIWKPLVDGCNDKGGCWTNCEDFCMIAFRPWRVL